MQRRISRQREKKRWKPLAPLFVVAVSGISIAGYVALSITLNGLPSNYSFQGWVALIQPASESREDKVLLRVDSTDESSSNPNVTYTVSACGPHPYSADLLLTGHAQLSNIDPIIIVGPGGPEKTIKQHTQKISLGFVSLGTKLGNFSVNTAVGSVQLIHLNITDVASCSVISDSQTEDSFPGEEGQNTFGQSISGSISAPLQQSWSGPWGWWHGPHASQSWPLVGGFGTWDSPPGILTFTGLPGRWSVPDTEYVEITSDDVPATWSMDSSMPTTSGPDIADWTSMSQISPTAQFTDSASTALLQDWIVISAVGLGIGGGMLATLLLEWIRPARRNLTASKVQTSELPVAPASGLGRIRGKSRFKTTHWLAAVGVAFSVGYARGQFRRRKS
jgi:hypothetical protein